MNTLTVFVFVLGIIVGWVLKDNLEIKNKGKKQHGKTI